MAEVTPLSLDDYDAIAEAVQETERGRWFLTEFARRNRAADTAVVLQALDGLERRFATQEPATPRAAGLVREALNRTRLARAAGADQAGSGLDDIERLLRLAAEALGATPPTETATTIAPKTEEPPTPRASLTLAPPVSAPPIIDVDALQKAEELAWLDTAPDDAPSVAAEDQVAIEDDAPASVPDMVDGEVETDAEPAWEAPAPATSAARAIPATVVRPSLLLDSLSEVEKAILFA